MVTILTIYIVRVFLTKVLAIDLVEMVNLQFLYHAIQLVQLLIVLSKLLVLIFTVLTLQHEPILISVLSLTDHSELKDHAFLYYQ